MLNDDDLNRYARQVIIPNFTEETWNLSTTNKAVALLKSERLNQQPYIAKYHQMTKDEGVNLIGVSKLPFEPRGERLLEFGKFLKNLTFAPIHSQDWKEEDGKFTLKLRFPHSGKVKLTNKSYKIDNMEYFINIPDELQGKRVRKVKTSTGATYTFK